MADGAQSFKWSGITNQGKRESGILQASDIREAQFELKKIGVEVISLAPHTGLHMPRRQKKIKPKDIQLFTRYLSTMLAAGLPIIQALELVSHDQENPAMKNMINTIKSDIGGGKSISETFSQFPKYFSPLYCNLIKAGEKSGTLDKILNRLAGYLEKTETLKRKIKKAMIYPIAILSVALIVSGILLIFVVPQFEKMFSSFGAQLPFFTRMVVNLSVFLRAYWWIILGVFILLIAAWRVSWRHNPKVINHMDRLKLKIYIIGPVLQKGIIARFTRTLSTTIEAGMPIVESMRSMVNIMGNTIYSQAVLQMSDDISSGHSLSTSMATSKLFPNMAIQMISIGEASGRLPEMLSKIADYYEDEVNSIVDNLSSLLEPLIMLILGVVVGSFVVAMYLPIFKIGSIV